MQRSERLRAVLRLGGLALLIAPYSLATNFQVGSNLSIVETQSVAVNLQYIDMDYNGTPNGTNPPTASECPGASCTTAVDGSGVGTFLILGSSSTGTFHGISGDADVHDLCRSGPGPCANPVSVGTPSSFANFVTFTSQPTWSIMLTMLNEGDFSPAGCAGAPGSGLAGQTCTPPVPGGSPFDLTNNGSPGGPATGVTISFTFQGIITDSAEHTSAPIQGTFSTNFSSTDLQTILADIAAGDAIVSGANATLTVQSAAGVPEPSSLSLLLIGGVLIGSTLFRPKMKKTR